MDNPRAGLVGPVCGCMVLFLLRRQAGELRSLYGYSKLKQISVYIQIGIGGKHGIFRRYLR